MKILITLFALLISVSVQADTDFDGMLEAAKKGDDMARVLIAYTYYFGEYRDGTKIEKNLNEAYAWASLANFQGNKEAKKLVNGIIAKLKNRKEADDLAAKYFKLYGATKGSSTYK